MFFYFNTPDHTHFRKIIKKILNKRFDVISYKLIFFITFYNRMTDVTNASESMAGIVIHTYYFLMNCDKNFIFNQLESN